MIKIFQWPFQKKGDTGKMYLGPSIGVGHCYLCIRYNFHPSKMDIQLQPVHQLVITAIH